jgi:hypothetical protein
LIWSVTELRFRDVSEAKTPAFELSILSIRA